MQLKQPAVKQLVATAPKGKAGVMAEILDDGFCLGFQNAHIVGRCNIVVARQGELLPKQDAVAVTHIIEEALCSSRSRVHAEEVHVGIVRHADVTLKKCKRRLPK